MSLSLLLVTFAVTLGAVLLVMAASFAIGVATGKYSVIDAIWGPGFVVVAWVAFAVTTGHGDPLVRVLLAVLISIWGLRLGLYVLIRNHGLPEDPRYTEMLAESGPVGVLRKVQLPQGLVMWFVSLPVQVGMLLGRPASPLIWIGVAVFAIGLFFESVGDQQLASFKADPANKGQVMNRGLWRYTRHPNYFGDATIWWGVYLIVAWWWPGALTVLSPLLMTYLITAKTGKALTEKRMSSSKPGYADYVARTSGFFPLPPKKAASSKAASPKTASPKTPAQGAR